MLFTELNGNFCVLPMASRFWLNLEIFRKKYFCDSDFCVIFSIFHTFIVHCLMRDGNSLPANSDIYK